MANDGLLAIYLNDHLGGSALAVERCRHARDRHRGSDVGAFLDTLAREIEADRAELLRAIDRVGAAPSRVKTTLAVVAERAGRLKPNGSLTGTTPLTLLLELELLSIGVEGKRLLWIALGELGDPRLAELDFPRLVERAVEQRAGIEEHRLAAARAALA